MATRLPRFFSSFIEKSRGVENVGTRKGPRKAVMQKIVRIIWWAYLGRTRRTVCTKRSFVTSKAHMAIFFRKTLYYHFRENTDGDGRPSIFWEKHHGLVTIRKKCSLSVSQLGLIMVMSPPESTTLLSNVIVILGVLWQILQRKKANVSTSIKSDIFFSNLKFDFLRKSNLGNLTTQTHVIHFSRHFGNSAYVETLSQCTIKTKLGRSWIHVMAKLSIEAENRFQNCL